MLRQSVLASLLLISSCSFHRAGESSLTNAGVDFHVHAHPDGEVPYNADRIITVLDSAKLSHACILSQAYQPPYGDNKTKYKTRKQFAEARNDWTLAEASKSERLIPFCSAPLFETWALDELKRCLANGGRGVKLHLASESLSLKNEKTAATFSKVLDLVSEKQPVLIHINHNDEQEVFKFFELTRQHLNKKVVAAHGLGRHVTLLKNAPSNLYVEISGIVMAPRNSGAFFVEHWRKFGIERVLLGSDWPIFHPTEHIYFLEKFPLTDDERKMIISGNAFKLLSLDQ